MDLSVETVLSGPTKSTENPAPMRLITLIVLLNWISFGTVSNYYDLSASIAAKGVLSISDSLWSQLCNSPVMNEDVFLFTGKKIFG